jgi:serine/threonine-protein kinase RsbT
MSAPDSAHAVVGALKAYFSEPIAKVLVASTLRRAQLDDSALSDANLGHAIDALERVIPLYITDERRRLECISRLRDLAPANDHGYEQPKRILSPAATTFRVSVSEDVSNAREAGRDIAQQVGFGRLEQMKIATAISELARNILLYAAPGEMRIAGIVAPRRGIEIVAADEGPGIPDVNLVMSTAYRSKTGMGMGMKGAKRLMDSFEVRSKVGLGTTIVARKYVP